MKNIIKFIFILSTITFNLMGCTNTSNNTISTAITPSSIDKESNDSLIELSNYDINVSLKDDYSLNVDKLVNDLIVSVTDPYTEKELTRVDLENDEKQENNTYVIDTSKVDITKAGAYDVTIIAKDSYGYVEKKITKVYVSSEIAKKVIEFNEEKSIDNISNNIDGYNDIGIGNENTDYILRNSKTRVYTTDELKDLSSWELMIARNEIYARYGRGFKNEKLAEHFKSKDWYEEKYDPDTFDNMTSPLNDIEKTNCQNIKEVEATKSSS